MSTSIQFRFLQVVMNHVADERVTVGLLHFDGSQLRYKINPRRVPDTLGSRTDVQAFLRGLMTTFRERSAIRALDLTLDSYSPVPVGETGLLTWGQLRKGQTSDPERHFTQLVEQLGLGIVEKAATLIEVHVPVDYELAIVASELSQRVARPELIRSRLSLHGLVDHESPLSWKNGVWHHTFPLDLRVDSKSFAKKLTGALGRIDASVPRDQVGVVVAVYDGIESAEASLSRAEEHITSNLAGRVETIRAPMVMGKPDFANVMAKVLADVAAASV